MQRADLGRGWSVEAPAPRGATRLTCRGFAPRTAGVREMAAVASPTFAAGSEGPFVSEAVHLYGTSGQARAVWRRVITPGLSRCVAAELTAGSTAGARYTVERRAVAALRRPGTRDRLSRYRIDGTVSGHGQTLPVHLDALVLLHGRTVGVLDVTTLGDPPSDAVERRLARAAAARLDRAR